MMTSRDTPNAELFRILQCLSLKDLFTVFAHRISYVFLLLNYDIYISMRKNTPVYICNSYRVGHTNVEQISQLIMLDT